MVKFIYCNFTPYTGKEKARAILFNNVDINAFKFAFIFDGVKYFKKVR